MLRNKTGAILIALQIAVTMAIMVNAISIMQERSQMMARPTGIDEHNIFHIVSMGFAEDFNERVTVEEDLAMLRGLPGVVNAMQSNSVPLRNGGWRTGLKLEPGAEVDTTSVAVYFVDEHGLETFGLNLLAGENFNAMEIEWRERSDNTWPDRILITQAMAETLYPDDPLGALGKTVYIGDDEPITIIGIIAKMQAPWNGWEGIERTMLVPSHMLWGFSRYIIRTEPGMRDELMPKVEELLAERNQGRVMVTMRSMDETRERSYRGDLSMIKMLTFTIVLLIVTTSLGIAGLANFSVNRRTKQIGTRRALGASKVAILRYFMTENFIISMLGILLGAVLTIGLNMIMIETFSLTRIAWYLVPMAMLMLLVVGQVAVFGPARRAASVPPAVATRSV
jgi:putative ABC transport system permease protein